jgi:hypothetical protein
MDKNNLKSDAEVLIEKIYKFKREKCDDLSLLDTIIEYSYQTDIPLLEIGNTLSEHEIFVNIFRKTLQSEKYFKKSEEDLLNEKLQLNEEEW